MRFDASVQWSVVCCTGAVVLAIAGCSETQNMRQIVLTTRTTNDQILGNVVVRNESGSTLGTTDAVTGQLLLRVHDSSAGLRLWLSPGGSDPASLSHSPGWLDVPAQKPPPLEGVESYTVRLSTLEPFGLIEATEPSGLTAAHAETADNQKIIRWSEDDLPITAAEGGKARGQDSSEPADLRAGERAAQLQKEEGLLGGAKRLSVPFIGRIGELRTVDEKMRQASEQPARGQPGGTAGLLYSEAQQPSVRENEKGGLEATSAGLQVGPGPAAEAPKDLAHLDRPKSFANAARSTTGQKHTVWSRNSQRQEERSAQRAGEEPIEDSGQSAAEVSNNQNAAGELLAAVGLRSGDPALLDSLALEDRAFQVKMATGEPLGGAMVTLISTQKNWELAFGTTNPEGLVAARVPSALAFQLLRVEHPDAGVLVASVTFSSEKKPARVTFNHAPDDRSRDPVSFQRPGVPFSLAFRYLSHGRFKFFRGGSIEIGPSDALGSEPLPWRQKMNSLSHFVVPPKQWERSRGAQTDEYTYLFQYGEARVSGSLTAGAAQTSSGLHHEITVLHQGSDRPRATLWYAASRELQSLDQTLVGRFQRALKARFINARSFIPVIPQRVAELASDTRMERFDWRSTALDPELDYIVVLSVKKNRLTIEWRNRAGKTCSAARLPFPDGRPPEYFANEVFNAIEDNFPDEVVVRVSQGEISRSAADLPDRVKPAKLVELKALAPRDLFKGNLSSSSVFYLQALTQNSMQQVGSMRVTEGRGADAAFKGSASADRVAFGLNGFSGLLTRCPAEPFAQAQAHAGSEAL